MHLFAHKQTGRGHVGHAVEVLEPLCGLPRYVAFTSLRPEISAPLCCTTPHNGCSLGRTVPFFSKLKEVRPCLRFFSHGRTRLLAIVTGRLPRSVGATLPIVPNSGMAIPTLLVLAHYLLTITKYLKLGKRGNELISMAEVEAAAARWAGRRHRPPKMQTKFFAQRRFLRHAQRWLQFIGRLEEPVPSQHAYAERVAAFAEFQREKGLSSETIHNRCRVVQGFLDRLCENTHMKNVTSTQIDNVLQERIIAGNLKRVSIRGYAHCLRTFFQYADTRGWCCKGLAAAIMAPVVYAQENIPAGPSREDVQRLLATTEGDRPADIAAGI